jgi:hypothetical protein
MTQKQKHVFEVEMAHDPGGLNYTSYVVIASNAINAIHAAEKLAGTGEYALEVKYITTLD